MHVVEGLRKYLSCSCKLLLEYVLAASPIFSSQIAYKNAIQFGNTSDEEELPIDKVEVWSCLRLDCVILLAPYFCTHLFTDVTYVFSETKLVIYVYSKNS